MPAGFRRTVPTCPRKPPRSTAAGAPTASIVSPLVNLVPADPIAWPSQNPRPVSIGCHAGQGAKTALSPSNPFLLKLLQIPA